ncbi:uncharacterized protein LOC131310343 isoform X3 [Rhododendron vialii]|uniref:uncharacterized protein LOC131310343 isoform X3 n=1 Tax=Rhododendron vialii TaxID=182163 RepID=UPI00265EC107|nr:uncharacterized protein LOC131310343 isoform X3 [Rhododendron vialii]
MHNSKPRLKNREKKKKREDGGGERANPMASFLLFLLSLLSVPAHLSLGHITSREREGGRRLLMSFKETPSGGNATFDCSPSGPCVACLYSEKDEKYRCSETGYRIPLKCEETGASSNKANSETAQKGRLLSDVSTSVSGSQAYITYRSCIPAVNEEKLSVLGFEGIMLGMLFISSSVIYIKRKRSGAPPGSVRIPTSSRF